MPPVTPQRLPLRRVRGKQRQGAYMNKKCQDAAEAETIITEAIKHTRAKTEALEKHVKTVTLRAESLATTEADFLKTLFDRHEETQRNLKELSAHLCQARSTQ